MHSRYMSPTLARHFVEARIGSFLPALDNRPGKYQTLGTLFGGLGSALLICDVLILIELSSGAARKRFQNSSYLKASSKPGYVFSFHPAGHGGLTFGFLVVSSYSLLKSRGKAYRACIMTVPRSSYCFDEGFIHKAKF
ncbi:hypothetical protein R3P38DRAFT_2837936 [Favolaschia claudopus]|uniref:Uncharacterized protein n=1 Tax=Favolaschia claudopus TaxID=2862362 RepID=A0AAW0E556_9AGAR